MTEIQKKQLKLPKIRCTSLYFIQRLVKMLIILLPYNLTKHFWQLNSFGVKLLCHLVIFIAVCFHLCEEEVLEFQFFVLYHNCDFISHNCEFIFDSCNLISHNCNYVSHNCNSCNFISHNCDILSQNCNLISHKSQLQLDISKFRLYVS